MAKLSFTKLSLKPKQEVKIIEYNNQKIEIKQYLPIEEKLKLITKVINLSAEDSNYSNPIKEDIYFYIELIKEYTNITFTDKQEEDILKLYDSFKSNDLLDDIIKAIPEEEYNNLYYDLRQTIDAIYKYRNSAMGVLDIISADYADTNVNLENIQKAFTENHDNIEFLKEVVTKMG